MGTTEIFSRLTRLHACGQLDPITNKGFSSTQQHQAAEGVKLLALALAGVELKSPGWIEMVETSSLVESTSLYPIAGGYDEQFPQTRFGMRFSVKPLADYEVLNQPRFGWRNYGLRAIVIEVTERSDGPRVVLHTLMMPCAEQCTYMTSIALDGSIRSWRFTGNHSIPAVTEAFIGAHVDLEQRQAVMESALPVEDFPTTKSHFASELVLMAQMVASYEKIPAGKVPASSL